MKLTTTHYYLALLMATLVVVGCIGTTYFYMSDQVDPITTTTSSFASSVVKQDDTLLSIQVAQDSDCNSSGALLTEEHILALPQQQFTTLHKWSPVAQTFSGPLLEDVLNIYCKDVTSIELSALNNYSLTLDFKLTKQYQPIVAHSINGNRLSIRDKGPLWVMIDHERHNIKKKNLEGMMIWQLSDIMILSADEKI